MNTTFKNLVQKTIESLGLRIIRSHFGYRFEKIGKTYTDPFALKAAIIETKSPVIFDVGAGKGEIYKSYRKKFPDAEIYCFEPFPKSYQLLSSRGKLDNSMYCYQLALSDHHGVLPFNSNRNSATNSLLKTDRRGAAFWGRDLLNTTGQIEVNSTTVDRFSRLSNIPDIDILKINVQGAEYSVLNGARNMLQDQRISLIYTELILCPTYETQKKLYDYFSLLEGFGYVFLNFFNNIRSRNQLIQTDVVFLSSSFRKKIGLQEIGLN